MLLQVLVCVRARVCVCGCLFVCVCVFVCLFVCLFVSLQMHECFFSLPKRDATKPLLMTMTGE